MAAEYTISTLTEIDKIEQEIGIKKEETYFKEQLPFLIEHLKQMFDINLKVVDLDTDDEDEENLKDQIGDEVEEIFGKDIARKIFKKVGSDKLSEDKLHQVLKARDTARIDNQWVLKKIDELENILFEKDAAPTKKKGWGIYAAEQNI